MAGLTFYFHTETALQGAPAPPTGCLTLSELAPDQSDTAAASIAGGHNSAATTGNSMLNKPTANDSTAVAGLPPTTAPPATAHQFGWFSDRRYNGTFDSAAWSFTYREDDNRANITGNPVINLYASTSRSFTGMRFLAQLVFSGGAAADWWSGTTSTGTPTPVTPATLTLNGEYLFVQIWCHETAISSGRVFTLHQEGSGLADTARTNLLTANYSPVISIRDANTRARLRAAAVVDTAERFLLASAQGWKDTAARFGLAVPSNVWRATVVRLGMGGATVVDSATRALLRSVGVRDARERVRLAAQAYRNQAARWKLAGPSTRDSALRYRLAPPAVVRDTVGRLSLAAQAYRNQASRWRLAGLSARDAVDRLRLRAQALRDTGTRFVLSSIVPSRARISWIVLEVPLLGAVRDTIARLRLITVGFRNTVTRLGLALGAYRDANGRFRLRSPATWRDVVGRFGLTSALALRDLVTRLRLSVLFARDLSGRLRLAGAALWRNEATRLRLSAAVVRDSALRSRFRSPAVWRDQANRARLQSVVLWRDAVSRLRPRAQAWRDATGRVALSVPGVWRDAAGRSRLKTTGYRDTGARNRVQGPIRWRDVSTRLRIAALAFSGAVGRARLRSVPFWRDQASRLRLRSTALWRDAAYRLTLAVRVYHDAAARVVLRASATYRDLVSRCRLASTTVVRDVVTRVRFQAQAWRLSTTRLRLRAQGVADVAERYRLRSVVVWRDSSLRSRCQGLGSRDVVDRLRVAAVVGHDGSLRFRVLGAGIPGHHTTRVYPSRPHHATADPARRGRSGVTMNHMAGVSAGRRAIVVPSHPHKPDVEPV